MGSLNLWKCDECEKMKPWFTNGWIEVKRLDRIGKNKSMRLEKVHFCGPRCLSEHLAFRAASVTA